MAFFDKAKKGITNIFKKKASKTLGAQYCETSMTRRAMTSDCTLTLSAKTEQVKEKMTKDLEILVKKYIDNPEKLVQFLKMKGVKVYKLPNADKFLAKIKEEEGFLSPQKGLKALVLNIFVGALCENKIEISFKTKEMMIFNTQPIDIYTVARALYKYKGFKNNLPGYDYKSQEIFKKVYASGNNDSQLANVSFKDICACKEALARDLESINFTIKLSIEYENSKKALKKLKETNSINI